MTSTSFKEDAGKAPSRIRNFETVQRVRGLWHRTQCLRRDWMELAGAEAPTFQMLREQGAFRRGAKFIGVERDAQTFATLPQDDHAVWIHDSLEDLLSDRDERLNNVGVLNFDGFDGPGEHLDYLFELLFEFSYKQFSITHAFCLILNVPRNQYGTREDAASWIAERIRRYTGSLLWDAEVVGRFRYRSDRRTDMFNVPVVFGI